jgi:hypothetical protein
VRLAALAAVVLLAGSGAAVDGADRTDRPRRSARTKPSRLAYEPAVIGMIKYDTGINAGFHPDVPAGSPNLNRIVGNRFNSALGGPLLMTGRVFSITVFPANDGNQSVSIIGPPNASNTAMVLDYQYANLLANQFNTIVLPGGGVPVGADFLGVFVGVFNGTNPGGLLGMSDMATMGQGYHAIEGFYAGNAMATMLAPVPSRNAMLRVRVDVFPVELMDFRLE